MPFESGSTVKKYRIGGLLGKGGMGEVYAAEDTKLGRKVAIKVLPASLAGDPDRLRRFVTEAKAASALNHPSILTIYDVEDVDGVPLLVTEFVDGQTLRDRLRTRGVTLRESLEIAVQVANALAAAHAAGIVHRDVKPENIMVREDGLAKLLDFGLAKLAAGDAGSSTAETVVADKPETTPGLVMGTTQYMSPEQARGIQIDARSDIFSLGVVLYEMAAGHAPFQGATSSDVIAALLKHDPPPIENPPSELDNILAKALEKERDDRHQTAKDLSVDLRRLRKHLDGSSSSSSPASSSPSHGSHAWAATPKSGSHAATASTGAVPAPPPSKRWLLPGAIVAGIAIVGVLAWSLRSRETPPPASSATTDFSIEKLSGLGDVSNPALSDDGKILAYVTTERGLRSISLRQMATGSAVRITEPTDHVIQGLQFAPDGSYLYYSERGPTRPFRWSIMTIPAFGGTPRQVIEANLGRITFSPDGKRFAAVKADDQDTRIVVFNVDGSNTEELGRRIRPNAYVTAAWSPSGSRLAALVVDVSDKGQPVQSVQVWSFTGAPERTVMPVGVNLRLIYGIGWLPGETELVVSGTLNSIAARRQLFRMSVADGRIRPLTQDLNDYGGFVISARTGTLAAIRTETLGGIWVGSTDRPDEARQLPSRLSEADGLGGFTWISNDRIAFTRFTDLPSIWTMDAAGANARRLTEGSVAIGPASTPDGQQIVFETDRAVPPVPELFVVPVAGGPARQLTRENGVFSPSVSPDGRTLVFRSNATTPIKLMKAPFDGGPSTVVFEAVQMSRVELSRDGRWIAVIWALSSTATQTLSLVPFDGGPARDLVTNLTGADDPVWLPDSRALLYTILRDGVRNLWRLDLVPGAAPRQVTHSTRETVGHYKVSPDGKRLAQYRGLTQTDIVLLKSKTGPGQ